MSWIRRLFGGGGAPSRNWKASVGTGVAEVWSGRFGTSPLHQLLDETGVPWRETRGSLAARIGIETDPAFEWPVLPFRTTPSLVEGLILPLSAQAHQY